MNDASATSPDPTGRVRLLAAIVWGAAVASSAILSRVERWDAPTRWPTWPSFVALLIGFAATEIFVVHVHFDGDAHTFSLVEIPLALGMFFAPPLAVIGAQFLGAGLALTLYRKQNRLKLAFNTGQFFFATTTVIGVYRALPHHSAGLGTSRLLAGAFSLGVGAVVTATLVFVVISTLTRTWNAATLLTGLRIAAATASLTTSLGVISAIVIDAQPRLAWLVAIPTGGIYLANWAFTAQHRRHEAIAFLYEFTAGLTASDDLDATLNSVEVETARVLRAAHANVVLHTDDRTSTSRSAIPTPNDDVWRRVLQHGDSLCLPRGTTDLDNYLEANNTKDLMAVPLTHGNTILGALVVRERLGEASTFDADDLSLLSTIANQTTVTLEKLRLIDRLRDESAERHHQALHDSLTGLPNRAQLYSELERRLPDASVAVAMLDLDQFKEVNDTLGHHAGDIVLVETAERLRRTLPSTALVARLGGDEFAIVLFDVATLNDAVAKLNSLEIILTQPIELSGMPVRIDASIGVAHCPHDGTDRATLLRHADVAMYTAKQARGTAVRGYDRSQERTSKRTLQLVGDLRTAIENDRLEVVFQPKVRLADGVVVGTEALARWHHPTFGPIGPDEFVPLAERAGFIDALTAAVLRQALTVCARWRRLGFDLGVAVNVDAHTLIGSGFEELVHAGLAHHNLPPEMLTLEITERDLVRELDTATTIINRLRSTGIKISIDDFGTGYSSLSYLARLPVDEVKIDRSFLNDLSGSSLNNAIIRAITDIASAMGATTVAEGIEDADTWHRLVTIGCTLAQGYFIGRPMSDDQLSEWLQEQPVRLLPTEPHHVAQRPRRDASGDADPAPITSGMLLRST